MKAIELLKQKNSEAQTLIRKLDWKHPATANNVDMALLIAEIKAKHALLEAVAGAASNIAKYANEGRTITHWTDKEKIALPGSVANHNNLNAALSALASARGKGVE